MILMRILVDLDGTIFNTYDVLAILFKNAFGCKLDWRVLANKSPFWKTEQGKWVVKQFKNPHFYFNLTTYTDAPKVLRQLARKHTIVYCTARRFGLESATSYSLGYRKLPFGKMYCIGRKHIGCVKKRIVQQEKIDIAIDDEVIVIEQLSKVCKKVLVFAQNYNANCKFGKRVKSWKEVKNEIKKNELRFKR